MATQHWQGHAMLAIPLFPTAQHVPCLRAGRTEAGAEVGGVHIQSIRRSRGARFATLQQSSNPTEHALSVAPRATSRTARIYAHRAVKTAHTAPMQPIAHNATSGTSSSRITAFLHVRSDTAQLGRNANRAQAPIVASASTTC